LLAQQIPDPEFKPQYHEVEERGSFHSVIEILLNSSRKLSLNIWDLE
jgi:hypothetical protein